MSVWSEVIGTLVLPKNSHFSITKYTKSLFDECTITTSQKCLHDSIHVTFRYSICRDGLWAAESIEWWTSNIPGNLDFTASIRWMK